MEVPAAPGPRIIIAQAAMNKIVIAVTIALGMSRLGFFASSAAIGTPSTARKNQIAKGIACHTLPAP